jgi:hypothetical protein
LLPRAAGLDLFLFFSPDLAAAHCGAISPVGFLEFREIR